MHANPLPETFTTPPASPLCTLAASRKISFVGLTPAQNKLLTGLLDRAEVGLCGYSAAFSASSDLASDFQVQSHNKIILHERILTEPAILIFHLRHAIELTLWRQLCARELTPVHTAAVVLLAAFTTRKFFLLMPTAARQQVTHLLPTWLQDIAGLPEAADDETVLRRLVTHLAALLVLQGVPAPAVASVDEAVRLAVEYAGVACPTEFTLTVQGDERLLIDPATGLNKYGCSPRPRPEAITFSSCTASSVSEFAYHEAETLRHRLMLTLPRGTLAVKYGIEIERIRAGLSELLDLDRLQTEVILSASGTDAELYPLVLFRSPEKKRLVNIIVAPDEVGSGTVLAASGRHFSSRTPHGTKVKQGDAVADLDTDTIDVICIPIRRPDGTSLTAGEIRQSVADAINAAAPQADTILLHVVDNTKTGLVVPNVESVLALHARYGSKLCVVVDACQFRLEKTNLHRYLAHGFCILITGSKFFTGPPFCGAFLIPPQFNIASDGAPLPRGFADYFTRSEVPPALQSQAQHLSAALNYGLLFRWIGALHEMRCFYSVPSPQRTAILQSFRSELIESIRRNPDLHLLESVIPDRWSDADQSLWDALPTIFSFAVRQPQSGDATRWLSIADLKTLYFLLNRDCTALLPTSAIEAERQLAAQRCHIGQPVTIARTQEHGETGALRIACGARLVYGITYDEALGHNPAERFQRELTDARTVLAKVSLIVKNWASFTRPAS